MGKKANEQEIFSELITKGPIDSEGLRYMKASYKECCKLKPPRSKTPTSDASSSQQDIGGEMACDSDVKGVTTSMADLSMSLPEALKDFQGSEGDIDKHGVCEALIHLVPHHEGFSFESSDVLINKEDMDKQIKS